MPVRIWFGLRLWFFGRWFGPRWSAKHKIIFELFLCPTIGSKNLQMLLIAVAVEREPTNVASEKMLPVHGWAILVVIDIQACFRVKTWHNAPFRLRVVFVLY